MLTFHIPGEGVIELNALVLDFNGTIATDGKLIKGVEERLRRLSEHLAIYVVTADTNGSVHSECALIPADIHIIGGNDQAGEKQRFIERLSPGTAAIGNGRNDAMMFSQSSLAIAVMGHEGCCTETFLKSDVVVSNAHDALDLLLYPNRLTATLRN
jgi:soluble P-type ATPase